MTQETDPEGTLGVMRVSVCTGAGAIIIDPDSSIIHDGLSTGKTVCVGGWTIFCHCFFLFRA